ncbi:MAG: polysaccharide deacetylase family protein [Bauldia sp.]
MTLFVASARAIGAGLALAFLGASHAAAFCTNPDALGVSRVLAVDTSHGLEVGRSQYPQSLPLQPKEVVLTFDDGPAPGTEAILRALEDQCVKATFFIVGARATLYPHLVEATAAAGHTIGTHSQNHPLNLQLRPAEDGIREINDGIASVAKALGHPPAPFFRFPGLGHTRAMRAYLAGIGAGVFGIDAEGGDWLGLLGPDRIRARSIAQLKEHDGGILLLHDPLRNTAAMLPDLLRDLKAQGFRIVHVVPAGSVSAAYAAAAAATPPRAIALAAAQQTPAVTPTALRPQPALSLVPATTTAAPRATTAVATRPAAPALFTAVPAVAPAAARPSAPTAPFLTPTTGDD